jgi:hypothetical protein
VGIEDGDLTLNMGMSPLTLRMSPLTLRRLLMLGASPLIGDVAVDVGGAEFDKGDWSLSEDRVR